MLDITKVFQSKITQNFNRLGVGKVGLSPLSFTRII